MSNPTLPFPVTFTVYDTDNTTLKSGVKCIVRNVTKKTISDVSTTNGSGNAIIDLANLPLASGQTVPYATGDVLLLIAYNGLNHDAARYVVAGNSKDQTLYLNACPFYNNSSERLMEVTTGNTAGSVAYCKIYNLEDGALLAHIETPANDTKNCVFGHWGKPTGGFVIEREANSLIVVATVK